MPNPNFKLKGSYSSILTKIDKDKLFFDLVLMLVRNNSGLT